MNIFKKIRAYLQLREAIRMADEAHEANGQRYYVIPNGAHADVKGAKLLVLSRADLKQLRIKHYAKPGVTTHDLLRTCFYHTPHRNGTGEMHPEERRIRKAAYYAWYSAS